MDARGASKPDIIGRGGAWLRGRTTVSCIWRSCGRSVGDVPESEACGSEVVDWEKQMKGAIQDENTVRGNLAEDGFNL